MKTLLRKFGVGIAAISLLSIAPVPSIAQNCNVSSLYGWASQNGGTTGGTGGSTVLVSTPSQLSAALAKSGKYIIYVQGTLTGYNTYTVTSDKTIYGLPGATIQGYLSLVGVSNVILRNLIVRGQKCADYNTCKAGSDAIHIESNSHHIWLDHMDIADGQDGNCDITHASDFITISWTKFHYTYLKQHAFCNLIGHVDGNTEDIGKLKVTFHHVWYADHIAQRQPRVRYGKVHVANNLYTSDSSLYLVGPGDMADVLVEYNVMKFLPAVPIYTAFAPVVNYTAVLSRGNVGIPGANQVHGTAFVPPYQMPIDSTIDLEASLRSCAGATLPDPRTVTGIEEEELVADHLLAIPNPFSNELRVEVPLGCTYLIMDMQGRLVVPETEGSSILQTSHFPSGIYLALLYKDGVRTKTVKLQKM
jgi:pectate lyase